MRSNPDIFTFSEGSDDVVDIRDFKTTGVVAFALGCPSYSLRSGRLYVGGKRVQIKEDYRLNCVDAMNKLVAKL